MANEIAISAALSLTLGGSSVGSSRQVALTLSGNEGLSNIDSAGTSDAALPLSALDTIGYILVENLDSTNFVELSAGTGGSFSSAKFAKIRPGGVALLQPTATTVYIKADTAACAFRVTGVEV